jgi:hypothetical protein
VHDAGTAGGQYRNVLSVRVHTVGKCRARTERAESGQRTHRTLRVETTRKGGLGGRLQRVQVQAETMVGGITREGSEQPIRHPLRPGRTVGQRQQRLAMVSAASPA